MVYCIPNAPHQHGDLWVKVVGNQVVVMDPAGAWWRGRSFAVNEFRAALLQTS